ncbi:hypothetical protein BH24ACI5_BH24ACI5_22320 [soil metagenome]
MHATRGPAPADAAGWGRAARVLLITLILVYGAVLRLAALTDIYGPVQHPGWLRTMQQAVAASPYLRPAAIRWDRSELFPHRNGPPSQYRSDPYTYLQYAREMRNVYAAHRREPLFPFATKVWLWLLSDQDVAVSFASAAFSVLAIAATFWLGAAAFGYRVGVGAAALMAIEYDLIAWGVGGWRDDAFMCAVVLTAVGLLRFKRDPGWRSGLALGIIAGGACLIRITSLSFILPALAILALWPGARWRERLIGAAVALTAAVCLTAPFLVNSWRVYGDPFYSINVHASDYQEIEGGPADASLTAGHYLDGHVRVRPMRTLDTVIQGLTVYPFGHKWHGFDRWHPSIGRWLSAIAVAGLILLAAFPSGRVLLVVLISSLVPFAATWKLAGDWRFTEHAYPFFLLAACVAVGVAARGLAMLRRPRGVDVRAFGVGMAWVGAAAIIAAAIWFLMARVLPVRVVAETLRAGEASMIMALDRDGAFFPQGWTPVSGGLPMRAIEGPRAVIHIPLPEAAAYDILLRIDPSADPIAENQPIGRIYLLLNGRLLARCEPGSTPDRIGVCRMRVPADAVRRGTNRIGLAAEQEQARGFRVWYVRIERAVE